MCCPCLPIIAPTAKAGMNRWTVSDSGCCCGEEGNMQWMFLNITNQTDRKTGTEQACMEMRGKSYDALWCLNIKGLAFSWESWNSQNMKEQFEPKEDSFIFYEILTILALRVLKNNWGVASLQGFCSYLSLSGFSSPCKTLQRRLLQAERLQLEQADSF